MKYCLAAFALFTCNSILYGQEQRELYAITLEDYMELNRQDFEAAAAAKKTQEALLAKIRAQVAQKAALDAVKARCEEASVNFIAIIVDGINSNTLNDKLVEIATNVSRNTSDIVIDVTDAIFTVQSRAYASLEIKEDTAVTASQFLAEKKVAFVELINALVKQGTEHPLVKRFKTIENDCRDLSDIVPANEMSGEGNVARKNAILAYL